MTYAFNKLDIKPKKRFRKPIANRAAQSRIFEYPAVKGLLPEDYRYEGLDNLSYTSELSLEELQERFASEQNPQTKGNLAFKISMAYYTGGGNDKKNEINKQKEIEWFLEAFKLGSCHAYWLAACIADVDNEDISDNFIPLKARMIQERINVSQEAADEYIVLAALGGHSDASFAIQNAIEHADKAKLAKQNGQEHEDDSKYANKIKILRRHGLEPSTELAVKMLVNAALRDHSVSQWKLASILQNKEDKRHDFAVASVRKMGIEPTEETISTLIVNSAFSGYSRAGVKLALAMENPNDKRSVGLVNVLYDNDIRMQPLLINKLKINAAFNGDATEAWYLAQAIKNPEEEYNQSIVRVLKKFNIPMDEEIVSCLVVNAAFKGHPDASVLVAQAVKYSDDEYYKPIIDELNLREIPLDSNLSTQLFLNAGLNGHRKSSRYLARVIEQRNEDVDNHTLLVEMKKQGIEPTDQLSDELTVLSAVYGNHEASDLCMRAMAEPDRKEFESIIDTFDNIGIKRSYNLLANFAVQAKRLGSKANNICRSFSENEWDQLYMDKLSIGTMKSYRIKAINYISKNHAPWRQDKKYAIAS